MMPSYHCSNSCSRPTATRRATVTVTGLGGLRQEAHLALQASTPVRIFPWRLETMLTPCPRETPSGWPGGACTTRWPAGC